MADKGTPDEWATRGPLGDYAFVVLWDSNVTNPQHGWWRFGYPGYNGFYGPFRMAASVNSVGRDAYLYDDSYVWKLRDSMSWWRDGTSNQIVIGEKHIPTNRIGLCDVTVIAGVIPNSADCTYFVGGESWDSAGSARSFRGGSNSERFGLARPNDRDLETDASNPLYSYGFGSLHPGVSHFLLGDGSVHSFSVTTSTDDILIPLADVQDGKVVSLP